MNSHGSFVNFALRSKAKPIGGIPELTRKRFRATKQSPGDGVRNFEPQSNEEDYTFDDILLFKFPHHANMRTLNIDRFFCERKQLEIPDFTETKV
ncbi:hypothetical protein TNCV_610721 [Trichonephila clavipes]|nr:hypothetical protein TNCV_610721 [Trichonephila clavipes]